MRFTRKRAFSMIEILLIVFLLSVGMTALIVAMNFGTGFVQKTRQKIIAVNLAREGMEQVMNIRDTNRNIRAWQKEECRLKQDPFDTSEWNGNACQDDSRFASGYYILEEKMIDWQKYFALSGGDLWPVDLSDGITGAELAYSLCQSWHERQPCPWLEPSSSEGYFLRQIVWMWLYDKNTSTAGWDFLDCQNASGPDSTCSDGGAKEFRFCSRVYYIWDGYGTIELCGLITNFAK